MKHNSYNIYPEERRTGRSPYGLTSYNLTSKLTSDSLLQLNYNNEIVYKKVSFWIQYQPKSIWDMMYRGKISLSKDAHQKLMDVVKKQYPELYVKKEARRLTYKT